MNSLMTTRKVLVAALVAVAFSNSGSLASIGQTAQALAEPINGLQLSIFRVQVEPGPPKDVRFRVELQNQGQSDLIIKLGVMLANGRKQYASDIFFFLTDPQGRTHRLKVPGPVYVAGRLDPFVLLLPVGASFSIPVDLRNCWPDGPGGLDPRKLEAGVYLLEAQLKGQDVRGEGGNRDWMGIALASSWKGTVVSNRLSFEVSLQ